MGPAPSRYRGAVTAPASEPWTVDRVQALSPVEFTVTVRRHALGIEEQPKRFWSSATRTDTVLVTAATVVALIDEVDDDRARLRADAARFQAADDRPLLKKVNAQRDALKHLRLRYQTLLQRVRDQARSQGIRLADHGIAPRGELVGILKNPPAALTQAHRDREAATPTVTGPDAASGTPNAPTDPPTRKTTPRRPAAGTQQRAPRARRVPGGWIFDSSEDTHVAVCPDCSWRTVTSSHGRMVTQAAEHSLAVHQNRKVHDALQRLADAATVTG